MKRNSFRTRGLVAVKLSDHLAVVLRQHGVTVAKKRDGKYFTDGALIKSLRRRAKR